MGELGPLIPDDSARLSRLRRRVRGISLELILLLAITLLSAPKDSSLGIDLRTWALIVGSAAPCLVGAVALWR